MQAIANKQKEAAREVRTGVAAFEDAVARMSLPESTAGPAPGLAKRSDESGLAFFNRLKAATDEQLVALCVGLLLSLDGLRAGCA
jgi:hypothetical protein